MAQDSYPHAMLREIYEQPAALRETLEAYTENGSLKETAFAAALHALAGQHSLLIAASGSSRHAGLVGRYLFEELSGLPVDVEYASEYIYRTSHTPSARCVLVLSQSGETADTLEALREARMRDAATIAITNVEDSTMARLADCSPTDTCGCGKKRYPATKSFTTQPADAAAPAGAVYGASAWPDGRTRRCASGLPRWRSCPTRLQRRWQAGSTRQSRLRRKMQHAETYLFLGARDSFSDCVGGSAEVKGIGLRSCGGLPDWRAEAWAGRGS